MLQRYSANEETDQLVASFSKCYVYNVGTAHIINS